MGKTRGVHETTPELRNRMVGMYEAGLGLRDIAAAVNCSQRTVKRWLNRFDKEGTVETRERCGRKRATTSEQDEAIIRLATQTPITAAKAVLPALGLTCSVDTIRERLHKAGIHNWSPSRKHMQRIPLGSEGDSATIQQAVWRPTGTQLGKKKILSKQSSGKSRRNNGSATKKRQRPVKIRARDVYVGDGAPANALKQPGAEPGFVFPQENIPQEPQQQQPSQSALSQGNNDMQIPNDPVPTDQTEFGNALSLVQSAQPVYQHHPGLNLAQNWPLDLVQGSHHYPQGQPHSMSHDQPPQQQQFQELHTQREQEHRAQQQRAHQQRMQAQQQQLQTHHQHLEQHQPQQHRIDHQIQQQHQQQQQQQQQEQQQIHQQSESSVVNEQSRKVIRSDSCSNSCSSNDQLSDCDDLSKDGSKDDCEESGCGEKRKKKGGKAKGTLETSVEIRNRMIGMSVAGLSTLSIALAINRSERTVKRWLERWNKEGNVQTKERKGRRRITTKEQDEAIIAMATQHPLTAAKHVAPALGLNCSVDTIRERLHKAGIHSWKLGKKQGEGNAVHTVHLWQPSGNRPNKPKLPNERRKKSSSGKKGTASLNAAPKRTPRKKKTTVATEPLPTKILSTSANMIPEAPTMQFHNNDVALANYVSAPEMMQSVHDLSAPPQSHVPTPVPPGSHGPPSDPQPMQTMEPLMQQRPDCRMVQTIVPPVPGHANPGVAYPSCMVSSHTSHMEQPDPLNYEPYIWSF